MSVEQTSQLIQLILNSVLMSVACAIVLSGLIGRHGAINDQLQTLSRGETAEADKRFDSSLEFRSRSHLRHLRRLQYRCQISRYSVLGAYYALLFSIFSCFALALRGILQWNALISLALGLFVLAVATLLVAVGLTLIDWHLGDRPLLDEARRLLSLTNDSSLLRFRQKPRRGNSKTSLDRPVRQKMRVG